MYATDLVCTYRETESNEIYQQELLQAFQAPTCEILSNSIEQLYYLLKGNVQLQELLQKVKQKLEWANKDHCFYFLFSYDYFSHTNEYIKDMLNFQSPKNHDFLCSLFE
jgi:hypothetical protein